MNAEKKSKHWPNTYESDFRFSRLTQVTSQAEMARFSEALNYGSFDELFLSETRAFSNSNDRISLPSVSTLR